MLTTLCFHVNRRAHVACNFNCLIETEGSFKVTLSYVKVKVKAFPYLISSVGLGADPDVQAVRPQVTVSHPPGGRLPLLSARPAVTSPATEHHRPLAGTKLYCLVTEARRCEQLAQGCKHYLIGYISLPISDL